jgi:2-dehydro-3-deoxyphosphogluconate aldolase/(4S)-4-hydroxy-2-oxoglutarate aldolase
MARFDRLTVLNAVVDVGLVPVFYDADLKVARQIVTACIEGGARVVEFTNRGDRAWNVFTPLVEWAAEAHPQAILGVGTVLDAPTAALYIGSGANFVVGPILNAEVARLCNRRKIAYMPGCGSASEISEAEELGVEIVKVFPGAKVGSAQVGSAQVGGPEFVRAVRGPMPWTRIMPTGGVDATAESIRAWFKAGVTCVGIGSRLITKHLVAARDWNGLSQKVAQVLAWIEEAAR